MSQKCFIKCIDNKHSPIQLNESQETFVGRSPETLIQDIFCSRNQVSLKVNLTESCVLVTQLGQNASGLNGLAIERNQPYKAYHNDILEIIHARYFYKIVFEPEPLQLPSSSTSSKTTPVKNNKQIPVNHSSIKHEESLMPNNSNHKKRPTTTSLSDHENIKRIKLENKLCEPCKADMWESVDSGKLIIFTSKGVISSNKIASFDIDGTIIKTVSGNVFAKNCDDWQIAFPEIPGKLKKLLQNKYKIVFFTNQAGMSSGRTDIKEWKKKLEAIVRKLNIPIQVFVATENDLYRKPRTKMWDNLIEKKNDDILVDLKESFYVGDAAGRPEKKGGISNRKKDHSLGDRLFAANIGLPFLTPEEYFQNVKTETWNKPDFDPKQHCVTNMFEQKNTKILQNGGDNFEVIIIIGCPASGKSFFAKHILEPLNYKLINRDTLKTWQKCAQHLEDSLKKKQSAVIDNTNPDEESRKRFIEIAKKYNANCRAFVMNTKTSHCKHNNFFRELTDAKHIKIKDMVIHSYNKKYQPPQLSEGFTEIVNVNFVPQFKNNSHQKLYETYLLEH